jgi:hypothetical protein
VIDNNGYKSKKDSSNTVSINKFNCINNNVNINGNNTEDVNVGNSGSLAATGSGTAQGYLDVGSLGENGKEGYGNGYDKQKGESFTCIINNNNINNNFGAGNATLPELTTATLTVNKEIFGCDNIITDETSGDELYMDCRQVPNFSPWLAFMR